MMTQRTTNCSGSECVRGKDRTPLRVVGTVHIDNADAHLEAILGVDRCIACAVKIHSDTCVASSYHCSRVQRLNAVAMVGRADVIMLPYSLDHGHSIKLGSFIGRNSVWTNKISLILKTCQ